MTQRFDVSCVCNVLVDLLLEVSEEELSHFGVEKGKMHLVNKEQQAKILNHLGDHSEKIELGGSSLNTIKALAQLGSKVSFAGMIGKDQYGQVASQAMDKLGIHKSLEVHKEEETGKCLVLVTPDGERTMNTYLGASCQYNECQHVCDSIKTSQFFHFSGYQWSSPTQKEVALKAIDTAKAHGCLVSFDLADPFVVETHKEEFLELLKGKVDLFFGNREETKILFEGRSWPMIIERDPDKANVMAVVKLDADGALIYHKGKEFIVPPHPANVLDTTGAGDMFAAGFLFGLTNKLDLGMCGHLASVLASDVISRIGATLSEKSLKQVLDETKKAQLKAV